MVDLPAYHELLWPTLTAVSELGGSGSIGEIAEAVVEREAFTEDHQAVLHTPRPSAASSCPLTASDIELDVRSVELGRGCGMNHSLSLIHI